jgi:hypothetical protein
MKSSQILRLLANLDMDLDQEIVVHLDGKDYEIKEAQKRQGGMYDGAVELELKELPPDPVHQMRQADPDS